MHKTCFASNSPIESLLNVVENGGAATDLSFSQLINLSGRPMNPLPNSRSRWRANVRTITLLLRRCVRMSNAVP